MRFFMQDDTSRGGLGPRGLSTLIERLPRPIPTDHGPSDPVIRVGGVWRRTSDIESSELVAALRVCPSMADTRVMPVISSEPVAVIC